MTNFQFTDIEFKDMMFNPSKVTEEKNIFDLHPKLKSIKIFKSDKRRDKSLDNNLVMLYIICMYDMNSPYRVTYHDARKRKIEVAHDVGFKMDKTGVFEEDVEDMLRGKIKSVQMKIVEFVRMHRNEDYAYLITVEESFYNMMYEVMSGNARKHGELKNIKEEFSRVKTDLLASDDNPYLNDELLRYIEKDSLGIRPEEIALKILNGEEPIKEEDLK